MQKIINYKVIAAVYGENLEDAVQNNRLERQVNEQLALGWQPYGNLSATRREGAIIFAQPMVKYAMGN